MFAWISIMFYLVIPAFESPEVLSNETVELSSSESKYIIKKRIAT